MSAACRILLAAAVLISSIPVAVAAQTPARDAAAPAATGTSLIAGVVQSDDDDSRGVRRARVSISSADRAVVRATVTDDQGRFSFPSLPAGRYSLNAMKQGFVPATAPPGRTGRAPPSCSPRGRRWATSGSGSRGGP